MGGNSDSATNQWQGAPSSLAIMVRLRASIITMARLRIGNSQPHTLTPGAQRYQAELFPACERVDACQLLGQHDVFEEHLEKRGGLRDQQLGRQRAMAPRRLALGRRKREVRGLEEQYLGLCSARMG